MAGSDKTVRVTLVATTAPYAKGMTEASTATRKLGKDIDGVSAKTKGLESGMGRASGAMKGFAVGAAAVAGTQLVSFLNDAVGAASDLGETTAKAGQIFGQEALPALLKFADGASEAMGQSKQQALDAAATFGVFGKSAGLAGQDLVGFSTQMTALAGDLASFSNTSPEEAITSIGAALRGESEPIRKYGILLDDATLRQRAMALGITKTTKDALTPQQRVLAAQAEILAQTSDAQGDFARTSGGLANQQRILTAEWANAKTELGEALLPAVLDATKALRSGVDVAVAAGHAWGEIPGPVQAAIAALVAFRIAQGPLTRGGAAAADTVRSLREALNFAGQSAAGVGGGFKGAAAGLKTFTGSAGLASTAMSGLRAAGTGLMGVFGGPLGLAVVGLTVAIGAFVSKHLEAQQRVEEFTAAIKADSGAIAENTREVVSNTLEKSGAAKAAKELGLSLATVTDAASGSADATRALNEQMDAARTRLRDMVLAGTASSSELVVMAGQQDKVRDAIGGTNDELNDAKAEFERHTEMVGKDAVAQQDYGTTTDTTTGKIEEQSTAIRDATQAVLDANTAKLSAFDAEVGYQSALAETAAALEKNGKTAKDHGENLDLTTEKGRANATALSRQAAEAKAVAEKNIEAGDSLKSVKKGMDDAREAFIANAEKAGLSTKAAELMADEFGLTRGTVDRLKASVDALPLAKQIQIEAETKAAEDRLATLKRQLADIKSKSVVVTTLGRFVNTGPLPNGGRSTAGGSVFADGGHVRGPGSGRSDSIPAWLSNGEYVLRAAAVAKYGTGLLNDINAMRFASGGAVRFSPQPQFVQMAGGNGARSQSNDNRLVVEQLVTTAANSRELRRDLERERRYQSNRSAS